MLKTILPILFICSFAHADLAAKKKAFSIQCQSNFVITGLNIGLDSDKLVKPAKEVCEETVQSYDERGTWPKIDQPMMLGCAVGVTMFSLSGLHPSIKKLEINKFTIKNYFCTGFNGR